MKNRFAVRLTGRNRQGDQILMIEVEGSMDQAEKVFDEFIGETKEFSVPDLEKHEDMQVEIVSGMSEVSYSVPIELMRFSNLWDAPITVYIRR